MPVRSAFFVLVAIASIAGPQYADAEAYAIDSERSWLRVLVFRAGLISRLGHNHVVSSRQIDGAVDIRTPLSDSTIELSFPVSALAIDDPALRDIEGDDFPGHVSEKDIRGTRKNMLGRKLLDAENFDVIRVKSTHVCGSADQLTVTAEVFIKGQARTIRFPARLSADADNLRISGTAQIEHSDLGLKPFSAAFGTLKVHRQLTVKFDLFTTAPAPDQEFSDAC